MSKKAHETTLPKLRFPEFRDTKAWEGKKLGELTHPISERNKKDKKLPVYSISNVNGFVPQSSQFEGVDSHARGYDITLYKIVGKNTFAYNPARINIGSIGYSGELNEVLISSLYVCFKTNDELNDLFLWHFIKSEAFNQAVNDTVEGGIRSYLFYENLATIKINIPSLLEQQKIAAALSSLDNLITAQTDKLTALQAHKRGLMQDLFPAEGKTVPKRRFLDFQDTDKWEEKKLGEICEVLNNRRKPIAGSLREKGQYPYYGASGIVDYVKDFIFDEKLLLVGEDGAKWGAYERTAFIVTGKYWVNNHAHVLRPSKIDPTLLEQYLVKLDLGPYVAGAAPPKLTLGKLKEIPIPVPLSSSEQQKIAAALSSLDNLITAQTQKIDALKLHKKGLMQALFPATSEPAA